MAALDTRDVRDSLYGMEEAIKEIGRRYVKTSWKVEYGFPPIVHRTFDVYSPQVDSETGETISQRCMKVSDDDMSRALAGRLSGPFEYHGGDYTQMFICETYAALRKVLFGGRLQETAIPSYLYGYCVVVDMYHSLPPSLHQFASRIMMHNKGKQTFQIEIYISLDTPDARNLLLQKKPLPERGYGLVQRELKDYIAACTLNWLDMVDEAIENPGVVLSMSIPVTIFRDDGNGVSRQLYAEGDCFKRVGDDLDPDMDPQAPESYVEALLHALCVLSESHAYTDLVKRVREDGGCVEMYCSYSDPDDSEYSVLKAKIHNDMGNVTFQVDLYAAATRDADEFRKWME